MNALEPGDAWLRVAPIDRGWRLERVRVALPTTRKSVWKVRRKEARKPIALRWGSGIFRATRPGPGAGLRDRRCSRPVGQGLGA
jgi:hypothetical protein